MMIARLGRFVEYSVFGKETSVDWTIISDAKGKPHSMMWYTRSYVELGVMLESEDIKQIAPKDALLERGENLYSARWREWLVDAKYTKTTRQLLAKPRNYKLQLNTEILILYLQ